MRAAEPPILEMPTDDATWARVMERITLHAHERLRRTSWELAEEIAQDALVDLLDPAYAGWDQERYPDLVDCLGSIVNGKVANHFRRMKRRGREVAIVGEVEEKPEVEGGDDPGDAPAEPPIEGEVVVEHAPLLPGEEQDFVTLGEVAMATLRARVANDTHCAGLLRLIHQGIGRPNEHAAALGVPIDEVYAAKRRLLHHARKVGKDLEAMNAQRDDRRSSRDKAAS